MRRYSTIAVALGGLGTRIFAIIGLSGIPDDLLTWKGWLSPLWGRATVFDLTFYDWLTLFWMVGCVFFFITWDFWVAKRWIWFDERIPFVEIRSLAIKRKLMTGDHNADPNIAYDIEKELTQMAADGRAKVWGRLNEIPLGSSPLIEISTEHFSGEDRFDIAHGNLHYKTPNDQSHTGRLGKSIGEFNGQNYCDLHLRKSDALLAIKAVKKALSRQNRLLENKQS